MARISFTIAMSTQDSTENLEKTWRKGMSDLISRHAAIEAIENTKEVAR